MERDDKDYAIEFGEYLAKAAKRFMDATNALDQARMLSDFGAEEKAFQKYTDAWMALSTNIHEFRRRAARAGHKPSGIAISDGHKK